MVVNFFLLSEANSLGIFALPLPSISDRVKLDKGGGYGMRHSPSH